MTADPHPRDDESGAALVGACPLCGSAVAPTDERCPRCSMTLAGTGGRPGPFSRTAIWWWSGALLVLYLVVLALVALFPA